MNNSTGCGQWSKLARAAPDCYMDYFRILAIPGGEAYGFRPFHEFGHLDQLLSRLDVADVVLSAFQALREVNLA
jgi:hypothetical protein